jgi:hypothetical protein
MAVFENEQEYIEAEREGWLRDGRLTEKGAARLEREGELARDNPGVDPRTLERG